MKQQITVTAGKGKAVNPFEGDYRTKGSLARAEWEEKNSAILPCYDQNGNPVESYEGDATVVWQYRTNRDLVEAGIDKELKWVNCVNFIPELRDTTPEMYRQIYVTVTPEAKEEGKPTFKGTPGPWTLCGSERDNSGHVLYGFKGVTGHNQLTDSNPIKYAEPNIFTLITSDMYGHYGAMEEGQWVNYSEIPHLANANLIAAAPELLEALQLLLAAYKSDGTQDFHNKDVEQIATKAINKALNQLPI